MVCREVHARDLSQRIPCLSTYKPLLSLFPHLLTFPFVFKPILSKRQENNLLLCPAIQLSLKYERKGDFDFDWKAQLYFIEVSNFYSFAFFQIYTFFYFSRCCHYKFRLFQKLLGTLLLKVSCDSLLRLQTSYSHFTNNFFLMLFQKIS